MTVSSKCAECHLAAGLRPDPLRSLSACPNEYLLAVAGKETGIKEGARGEWGGGREGTHPQEFSKVDAYTLVHMKRQDFQNDII